MSLTTTSLARVFAGLGAIVPVLATYPSMLRAVAPAYRPLLEHPLVKAGLLYSAVFGTTGGDVRSSLVVMALVVLAGREIARGGDAAAENFFGRPSGTTTTSEDAWGEDDDDEDGGR